MKPYLLVLHNKLKFLFLSFKYKDLKVANIQMFSRNLKISLSKGAKVNIGNHTVTDGRCVIVVGNSGELLIGNNCYFNESSMISVQSSVKIGNGVLFGPNVKIFDNNHIFDKQNGVKYNYNAAPVVIGDNTWLATNVVVLKGTTIGKNCVIGANCVVQGHIPDCSIVTNQTQLKIKTME